MKKLLLSILLGIVLAVPGCGPSGDIAAPEEEEEVAEETAEEEDTAQTVEEEAADEEEPELEEVVEEVPADEEEEAEEPAEEVAVPKAEFKSSNLMIVHNEEVGMSSYTVTVDVRNVGDLVGKYSFKPRVGTE